MQINNNVAMLIARSLDFIPGITVVDALQETEFVVTSLEDKHVEFKHNTYYLRGTQQVLYEKPQTIPALNQELKEVTDALGQMRLEEDNLSNTAKNSILNVQKN